MTDATLKGVMEGYLAELSSVLHKLTGREVQIVVSYSYDGKGGSAFQCESFEDAKRIASRSLIALYAAEGRQLRPFEGVVLNLSKAEMEAACMRMIEDSALSDDKTQH